MKKSKLHLTKNWETIEIPILTKNKMIRHRAMEFSQHI